MNEAVVKDANTGFAQLTKIGGTVMMEQEMNLDTAAMIPQYISSEVRFYNVQDMMEMSGWSENVIHKLFNDPEFPVADFGRAKIVEAHALINYFSVRRTKTGQGDRKKGELKHELRSRVR